VSDNDKIIDEVTSSDYKYGFSTEIDSDTIEPGLSEDVIRQISLKKDEPQWMTDWRLDAYKVWKEMDEPDWANVSYSMRHNNYLISGLQFPSVFLPIQDVPLLPHS